MSSKFLPLLCLFLAACAPQKVDFVVTDLRCEYLSQPLGIETPSPRLSWKMVSAKKGAAQSAYHILVATSEALLNQNKADLWDTGFVRSDQSSQIEYQGKPLTSGQKLFWKVQIRNQEYLTSAWSEMASWEMALLHSGDWQAKWIGAPASINTGNHKLPAPYLRREFEVKKTIRQARAYISGLGYYELSLNGQKVGDHQLSPNQTNYDRRRLERWNEPKIGNMTTTVLYETHDITSCLKMGRNAIGVWLGNGWYIQADRPDDTMLWYNTPRLLAQLVITYTDDTQEVVVSDEQWKAAISPILYNGLHSGEVYDARLEQKGWNSVGFDDSKWKAAELTEAPTGKLHSQVSPPDRITRSIHPIAISERSPGVYRYDLGEMISGWARLSIQGKKGTQLQLRFLEELGPGYDQTDSYILKGEGLESWEPRFTWHAFRYVEVSGSPVPLTLENLQGRVVNTDIQPAGSFECSNPLLNQLLDNYRRTQLGNVHGGLPSDCPHRERRGYTGDGQISAKAAIYNFDLRQFYTKWLNDIRDAQNHTTGYVPNTTPYQDGGGGTAWGSAYIIIPWYLYQYYGDTRILREHYQGMKHWIEYMKGELDQDGILVNQGLGEWVPPEQVALPPDFVNSCYYYHCCRLMTEISNALDQERDQEQFKLLAEEARMAINKRYFNSDTNLYSVGKQSANAFPLGFGIVEENSADSVFSKLLKEIVVARKAHFDTGILGTPLLLEVLTEQGRADVAYTLMTQRDYPSFGYMIEKGATTIWETWLGDASHSHPMFGSVCAWFYERLGGIAPDPEFPGMKNFLIKPIPVGALSYVNCSYPSAYGTIRSNWKLTATDFQLEVTVPPNSRATVSVPARSEDAVLLNGQPFADNRYVKFQRFEEQMAVYEVNPGSYQFISKGLVSMLKNTVLPTPMIHPGDTLIHMGDSVLVTIHTDTKASGLYYTLNNSEPDTASNHFEKGFYLSNPAIVKARMIQNGGETSYTSVSHIDFVDPKYNGLAVKYYVGAWTRLPDFAKLPVAKEGTSYLFSLEKIAPPKDQFALTFEGDLLIEKTGNYRFYLQSNDGSRLFLDNRLLIDHDGAHSADTEKVGDIELTQGKHPVTLHYFQAGGGLFLQLKYEGPGIEKQEVPAKIIFKR